MTKLSKSIVSAVLVFTILLSNFPAVLACGPFTVDPLFSFTKHIDYPLTKSLTDRPGIVPQSYGRISLFVFYRQLNNLPFTPAEKNEVGRAIAFRIGTHWSDTSDSSPKAAETPEDSSGTKSGSFDRWKAARTKVVGGDAKTAGEKHDDDDYSSYTNCLDDAFKNAAATLESRMAKYGTDDNVKEWVNGQDAVFSNCDKTGQIPGDVNASAPDWLKKDRQYQIAAANFYAEKLPESRTAFERIAADSNSPWRQTAKFVAARTYIRQASFIDDENPDYEEAPKPPAPANANITSQPVPPPTERKVIRSVEDKKKEKSELLAKADSQLEAIISDNGMAGFHESAHRLLNLVRYRGNPQRQRVDLAQRLAQPGENKDIFNNLTDYVWLLDKVSAEASEKGIAIEQKQAEEAKKEYDYNYQLKLRDISPAEMGGDLTDWLYSYQAADSFDHSYSKWKETKRVAWFVAAIAKAKKDSPRLPELLAEADKLPATSPAYTTARYHQIQLLAETGRRADAKQKLGEIMGAGFNDLTRSTQNKFLAQRMVLAENLDEFLKYAQRRPATFIWSDDGNEEGTDLKGDKEREQWTDRTMFDEDSVAFFNEKMPLAVLRQAALSPNLPEHLKRFLVIAVWTKAFTLKNQAIEKEFAPLMQRYDKDFGGYFSKLSAASTPAGREAAGLLAVLNNPTIQPYVPVGMGREGSQASAIDSIRGNWWCVDSPEADGASHYDHYPFTYPEAYPKFLTAAQTAAATKEQQQLAAGGSSATSLARRANEFATTSGADPNVPEILHLSVRATRYGCKDAQTLKYSKANFDILHKRFPSNPWTKKTPYFFGQTEN